VVIEIAKIGLFGLARPFCDWTWGPVSSLYIGYGSTSKMMISRARVHNKKGVYWLNKLANPILKFDFFNL
jgi:hypothetical protein